MILVEENFGNIITESCAEGKKTYLSGVMMEWGVRNRNNRTYSRSDMERAVNMVNEAAAAGHHILAELDHPNTLEVKLENVSHRLLELKIQGNQVIGKAEVLTMHPKGAILKSLLDHKVAVGVSSRGGGTVNESTGEVSNFSFVTIDAVATPSCRTARPSTIMESLELYGRGKVIHDLSESVIHDKAAQKYFVEEMRKFISSIQSK